MMKISRILPWWVLWLTSGWLAAAELRLVAFDLPRESVAVEFHRKAGGMVVASKAEPNRFSDPFELAEGAYQVRAEGLKGEVGLGIGGASSYFLVLLWDGVGRWRLLPVEAEEGRFRPGGRMFINASPARLVVRIGGQQFACKPGEMRMVPPMEAKDGKHPVEMRRQDGEKWVVFNSTWWPVLEEERSFVLVYPEGAKGRLRVKSLAYFPESDLAPE